MRREKENRSVRLRKLELPELRSAAALKTVKCLPMVEKNAVWHVGNPGSWTKTNGDFEGPLFSVSVNPREWSKIARLGAGEVWKIERAAPLRLVDVLRIKRKDSRLHMDWAREEGLVEKVRGWEVQVYDEEGEIFGVMFFDTLEEARISAEQGVDPKPVQRWGMSAPLLTFWNQRCRLGEGDVLPSPLLTETAVLCLLAETAAFLGSGEVDGLWWEEKLSPYEYSAPRGALCTAVEWDLKREDAFP